jgi:hypothetical protein
MSIVLRVNKGSALTYDEMDRNQSQFFYSSSLHTDNTKLRLHYTGSTALNEPGGVDYGPRYIDINLNPNQQDIVVPTVEGANKQVQFNDNLAFGASSNFVFDKTINSMGIGTSDPSAKLDIYGEYDRPAAINLHGFTSGPNDSPHSVIRFYEGNNLIGRLGRINITDSHIYITNQKVLSGTNQYGKIIFSINGSSDNATQPIATVSYDENQKRFGVGTTNPDRQITAVGDQGIGIGNTGDNSLHSYLKRIPSDLYSQRTNGIHKLLPPSTDTAEGLLISSPYATNGGNVVVNLNTDNNTTEGFNIIKSTGRSGTDANFATSTVLASFQASGKVGINTNFPSDIGLTVAGIISGSGNAQIDGTLTVGGALTIGTLAAVTGTGTNKTVVADSNGLLNHLPAAPVPFGGIIMWSGNTNAVPEGWVLCNLGSSVSTELGTRFVPDLTNKFIIGWNGDVAGSGPKTDITGTDTTEGGSKDAIVVAHTHSISDPGHDHDITRRWTDGNIEHANLGSGNDGGNMNSTARTSTEYTGISIDSEGSPGTNKNLPPYYALAFIMYVGV